jgi:hypothetical protein
MDEFYEIARLKATLRSNLNKIFTISLKKAFFQAILLINQHIHREDLP